jgi:hypothetical protein
VPIVALIACALVVGPNHEHPFRGAAIADRPGLTLPEQRVAIQARSAASSSSTFGAVERSTWACSSNHGYSFDYLFGLGP